MGDLASTISEQVLTAATALAGLILVFLGNVASSFEGYPKEDQRVVRPKYRKRAWLAFGGFAGSLAAAGLAILHNFTDATWLPGVAVAVLVLSLVAVFFCALQSVVDIG